MAEVSTYQLTDFQFANMFRAANGGATIFAVLEPCEKDDEKLATRLADELRQMRDLIGMNLLTDVSKEFTEQITVSKLNQGRAYIVVKLTDLGQRMFERFHTKRQWIN